MIIRDQRVERDCDHWLCDKKAVCQGLCSQHYAEKSRREDPDRIRKNKKCHYLNNREAYREKNRANYEATKEDRREENYRTLYNITIAEYDMIRDFMERHPKFRMLLNRPGRATRREAVEHRHKDGLVRGVMGCMLNRAYGLIERMYGDETADVLDALAEFHRNPPAERVFGTKVYGLIGKAQKKKKMLYGPDGSPVPQTRSRGAQSKGAVTK